MKRVLLPLVVFFGLVLLWSSLCFAQALRTTIDEIVGNPGHYATNAVEVEGLVYQYVPATSSTTSYYMIRGDYGAQIKVNTSEPAPETNKKYRVSGIVYVDPVSNEPFISEKSKTSLEQTPPPPPPPPTDNTLIYTLGALLVVLIGAFVYFITRKKPEPQVFPQTSQAGSSSGPGTVVEPPPTMSTSSEFKTVRISVSSPKTLKFIPGQLVLVSGEDKGKSFRIAGYPTSEGSVASIGREAVSGDRAYSHIQIDSKFTTVSRKQAELISREGKLYVRNLSETNPTQVDGIEIKPGQLVELKPDSIMRTGELEFQYKL